MRECRDAFVSTISTFYIALFSEKCNKTHFLITDINPLFDSPKTTSIVFEAKASECSGLSGLNVYLTPEI